MTIEEEMEVESSEVEVFYLIKLGGYCAFIGCSA